MANALVSRSIRTWYTQAASGRWTVPTFIVVWTVVVVVPLFLLLLYSFLETKGFKVVWDPGFKTWDRFFETGRWTVAMRTLRIAIGMTVIELVLAFPFALWLAKGCRSQGLKAILLTLLTIPFFLDLSSRTIIWRALLGSNGVVNTVLMELGITSEPVEWLIFTEFSVFFGLAAPNFATMVFPIFLVATLIDDEYLDASRDLGANPLQTLFLVTIPLCLPGVIAGVVFTMVPMMGEWVVPQLMGGGKVNMIGRSTEDALSTLNYPTAASLSAFVLAMLVVLLAALTLLTRRRGGIAGLFEALKL